MQRYHGNPQNKWLLLDPQCGGRCLSFFYDLNSYFSAMGTIARSGGGKDLGLPILIGPHKRMGVVERFHIAELKGSTFVRDRSMSCRLVPAALKSTYALCSGSLIRKIELGWESTM